MSKEKFSSGDWVVYIGHVSLNCGFVSVCCGDKTVYGREMYKSTEIESIANANLIAAAPEMYEEIERDIEWLKEVKKSHVLGSFEYRSITFRVEAKNKLLAKARGES